MSGKKTAVRLTRLLDIANNGSAVGALEVCL